MIIFYYTTLLHYKNLYQKQIYPLTQINKSIKIRDIKSQDFLWTKLIKKLFKLHMENILETSSKGTRPICAKPTARHSRLKECRIDKKLRVIVRGWPIAKERLRKTYFIAGMC